MSQTLFKRETFSGQGVFNSGSPGSNFSSVTGTLTRRLRGAYVAASGGPGYSGEIAAADSYGTWTCASTDGVASAFQLSCSFHVKAFNSDGTNGVKLMWGTDGLSSGTNEDFSVQIKNASTRTIVFNYYFGSITTTQAIPLNQWFDLAVIGVKGATRNLYLYYRDGSTPWTQIATIGTSNSNSFFTSFSIGSIHAGGGTASNNVVGLISAPTLMSVSGVGDNGYPADLTSPATNTPSAVTFYFNAATGNDSNAGTSSGAAFQTIAQFNSMSHGCGFLPGDTAIIDSSTTPFDFGTSCLEICWNNYTVDFLNTSPKMHKDISGAWTQYDAVNYPNIWQTNDNSSTDLANIYVWENLVTLDHPAGASITAVRSALNAAAGTFWTDGTTIYLHTTDGSNPNTNGKTYSRSRNRTSLNGSALSGSSAIVVGWYKNAAIDSGTIKNLYAPYARTTLCDVSNGNLPGNAYVVQWDTNCTGTHNIQNCNVGYWSKHALGRTCNGACTVNRTDITYGPGAFYAGSASQSADVDFNGSSTTGNAFNYTSCTFGPNLLTIGAVGGTANPGVAVWTSHGTVSTNFGNSSFVNCSAASMQFFEQGVCCGGTGITFTNCSLGFVSLDCPATLDRCVVNYLVPALTPPSGATAVVQNSIIVPTASLTSNNAANVAGTVTIQGCTIDISGNGGTIQTGEWTRFAALNLTFRNNVIIGSGGTNQCLIASVNAADTVVWDYNEITNVGSSATWAYGFKGLGNLTVAQFRAQNYGTNSKFAGIDSGFSLKVNTTTYKRTGAPTVTNDLGSLDDYTGKTFTHRKTPGAYEYVMTSSHRVGFQHLHLSQL